MRFLLIGPSKRALADFRDRAETESAQERQEFVDASFLPKCGLAFKIPVLRGLRCVTRLVLSLRLLCAYTVTICFFLACVTIFVAFIGAFLRQPNNVEDTAWETGESTAYDSLAMPQNDTFASTTSDDFESDWSYKPTLTGQQIVAGYEDTHTFFSNSHRVPVSGHYRGDTWIEPHYRQPPGGQGIGNEIDAHAKSAATLAAVIAADFAWQNRDVISEKASVVKDRSVRKLKSIFSSDD